MTIEELKAVRWPVTVEMEVDPGRSPIFVAYCPEFRACIAQGGSANEAVMALRKMLPAYWEGQFRIGALTAAEPCPIPPKNYPVRLTDLRFTTEDDSANEWRMQAEWHCGTICISEPTP